MMRVCVVSVFHNRAETVERTVESLRAQDYHDLEIVLVDDGSDDDTYDRLRCYEAANVRVLSHANKGFTAALKDAIDTTDSHLIAIHGSGDVSCPRRISTQVELMKSHPDAVAAGCGIVNVDELTGSEWEVLPPRTYRAGPIERGFDISHGELMVRRDAYDCAGGYRPFFRLGQASDLLRRMTLLGGIVYSPEVLYRRYLTSDGVNSDPEKIVMRNLYAALSIQALRRRPRPELSSRGRLPPDEIDRYGALAPYFLPPDPEIAKAAAAAATQLLELNKHEEAKQYAAISLRNKRSLRGIAAWCLAWAGPRAAKMALARRRSDRPAELNPLRFLDDASRAKSDRNHAGLH